MKILSVKNNFKEGKYGSFESNLFSAISFYDIIPDT